MTQAPPTGPGQPEHPAPATAPCAPAPGETEPTAKPLTAHANATSLATDASAEPFATHASAEPAATYAAIAHTTTAPATTHTTTDSLATGATAEPITTPYATTAPLATAATGRPSEPHAASATEATGTTRAAGATDATRLMLTRRLGGERARMIGFAVIGLSGFIPNLVVVWLLTGSGGLHEVPSVAIANQAGILWNFLLTDQLLYRGTRLHRPWPVRLIAYAGLSNTDLLLRVPLTAWLVSGLGGNPVTVTGALLLLFAAARFLIIDRLLYRSKERRSHESLGPTTEAP